MRQTPYSNKNIPIYTLTDPVGIDAVITDLQSKLGTISWMTKNFGRAKTMAHEDPEAEPESVYIFPAVFTGANKDMADVLLLDNYAAYSFMMARGSETPMEPYFEDQNTFQREVHVFVWADLSRVDTSKNYDFTEEIKDDVLEAIRTTRFSSPHSSVQVTNIIDIDSEESIFEGFTYSRETHQNLHYPFTGFRVVLEATYISGDCGE